MKQNIWPTNTLLLELFSQGAVEKEQAFRYLYARFQAPIVRAVQGRGGRGDAGEELFQQTMVAFYESFSAGNFRKEMPLEPYIWGIVNHLWRKNCGYEAKVPLIPDGFDLVSENHSDASFPREEAQAFRSDVLQLFALVLGPESQRILQFAFFESYSNDVIASRLGKKESSVKTIKSRAIAKLRAYVEAHPSSRRLLYSPFS